MKKKAAQSSTKVITQKSLPEGFLSEETPKPELETAPVPLVTNLVTEKDQLPAISVPQIDKDAELKIESAPINEEAPAQEKKNIFYFMAGTVTGLLIIVITIVLGYFYLFSPNLNFSQSKTATPSPSLTPELTPSVTPSPTLAKSEISIEILNGSGKTGEAAKIGKQMEALGYKVDSLGNAPDQTGTTILLSKSLSSQKDNLTAELKKEFPLATVLEAPADQKSLIQITIGK